MVCVWLLRGVASTGDTGPPPPEGVYELEYVCVAGSKNDIVLSENSEGGTTTRPMPPVTSTCPSGSTLAR